jgi:IS30 family transposase
MLLATGGQELNEKHLTSEQRSQIQNGLNSGKSFKEIGREIGKDCTSVSREIRRKPYCGSERMLWQELQ